SRLKGAQGRLSQVAVSQVTKPSLSGHRGKVDPVELRGARVQAPARDVGQEYWWVARRFHCPTAALSAAFRAWAVPRTSLQPGLLGHMYTSHVLIRAAVERLGQYHWRLLP